MKLIFKALLLLGMQERHLARQTSVICKRTLEPIETMAALL